MTEWHNKDETYTSTAESYAYNNPIYWVPQPTEFIEGHFGKTARTNTNNMSSPVSNINGMPPTKSATSGDSTYWLPQEKTSYDGNPCETPSLVRNINTAELGKSPICNKSISLIPQQTMSYEGNCEDTTKTDNTLGRFSAGLKQPATPFDSRLKFDDYWNKKQTTSTCNETNEGENEVNCKAVDECNEAPNLLLANDFVAMQELEAGQNTLKVASNVSSQSKLQIKKSLELLYCTEKEKNTVEKLLGDFSLESTNYPLEKLEVEKDPDETIFDVSQKGQEPIMKTCFEVSQCTPSSNDQMTYFNGSVSFNCTNLSGGNYQAVPTFDATARSSDSMRYFHEFTSPLKTTGPPPLQNKTVNGPPDALPISQVEAIPMFDVSEWQG